MVKKNGVFKNTLVSNNINLFYFLNRVDKYKMYDKYFFLSFVLIFILFLFFFIVSRNIVEKVEKALFGNFLRNNSLCTRFFIFQSFSDSFCGKIFTLFPINYLTFSFITIFIIFHKEFFL